tara:strand:- start:778 stop:1278 length:501 start_codon:yes stop_codon:yes gene_type:complete
MINDKIVLLTIFLYIILNLRKVENFIREGFTAVVVVGGDKIPTERIMSVIWCFFKLVIFTGYTYWFYNGENKNYLLIVNFILIFGLIIFSVGVLNNIPKGMEKRDVWLPVILALETISNEYLNVIMIYIFIKVSIDNIKPKGKLDITEVVDVVKKALDDLRNADEG